MSFCQPPEARTFHIASHRLRRQRPSVVAISFASRAAGAYVHWTWLLAMATGHGHWPWPWPLAMAMATDHDHWPWPLTMATAGQLWPSGHSTQNALMGLSALAPRPLCIRALGCHPGPRWSIAAPTLSIAQFSAEGVVKQGLRKPR